MRSVIMNLLRAISVEPIILLYMGAIMAEMPALQDMIFGKMCLEAVLSKSANDSFGAPIDTETAIYLCDRGNFKTANHSSVIDEATDRSIKEEYAHYWGTSYQALLFASSFFACIYSGTFSDKFGRKIPLLFPPLLSLCAQFIFMTAAANFLTGHWVQWLLVGSFLSGISGGSSSVIANSYGYVTDVSSLESRSKRVVIVEGSLFLGMSLGSYITRNILIHYQPVQSSEEGTPNKDNVAFKYMLCFGIIAVIHMITVLYTMWRIKNIRRQGLELEHADESLKSPTTSSNTPLDSTHRKPTVRSILNFVLSPRESFIAGILSIFKRRPGRDRLHLLLLTLAALLCYFGLGVQLTLLFTFVKDQLHWSGADYALYQTIEPLVAGTALIALPLVLHAIDVYSPSWRPSDTLLAALGFTSRVIGYSLMGFATDWSHMGAVIGILVFSNYAIPMVRSMISKIITTTERGKVFAVLACVQSLVHFVGGYLFPLLYTAGSRIGFVGLSFEMVALMQFFALLIIIFLHFSMRPTNNNDNDDGPQDPSPTTSARQSPSPSH